MQEWLHQSIHVTDPASALAAAAAAAPATITTAATAIEPDASGAANSTSTEHPDLLDYSSSDLGSTDCGSSATDSIDCGSSTADSDAGLSDSWGGQEASGVEAAEPLANHPRLPDRYSALRDSLLYSGCPSTVSQAAFAFMKLKRQHKIRDTQANKLLRLVHDAWLPAGNLLPKSLHLMKRVLGCTSGREFMHHACPSDCHSWPYLPEDEWAEAADDACPACDEPRFRKVPQGNGTDKLVPQKVWDPVTL